jgi:hypothetical protein
MILLSWCMSIYLSDLLCVIILTELSHCNISSHLKLASVVHTPTLTPQIHCSLFIVRTLDLCLNAHAFALT